MRLLKLDHHGVLSLTGDLRGKAIPPYAILSHTWGPDTDEVTFQDIDGGTWKDKPGYEKLKFCAKQAKRDHLEYFWVDTCCIDKRNMTELSEAITSMFRWYRDSKRCYVYLSDTSITRREQTSDRSLWEPAFRESRWFTRGWTLQELIAPTSVELFTREGFSLGDKSILERQIHEITGIAIPALQGEPLREFGVDERFKWAETRQTTREEDWAYCLVGIFGVSMPLLYGEDRSNAVRRLRNEIDDLIKENMPVQSASCSAPMSPTPTVTAVTPHDPSAPFVLQRIYRASHSTSSSIRKSALSISGSRFVVSEDGSVHIWAANDTGEFQRTQTIDSHKGNVILSISPEGETVAIGQGKTLQLWIYYHETKRFELDKQYEVNDANISTMAFSREGRLLAAGHSSKYQDRPQLIGGKRGTEFGIQVWELTQQ